MIGNFQSDTFINDLINHYKDFLQSNKFFVQFNVPTNLTFQDINLGFFIKNVNLPSKSTNNITINLSGYKFYLPNTPQFEPLTITFVDDIEEKCWNFVNNWFDNLNKYKENKFELYKLIFDSKLYIYQYDRIGNLKSKYEFNCVIPTSIGEKSFDYDNEQPIEFTVTFNYSYWKKVK